MRVSVLLQWSLLISRLLVTVLIRVFIAPVVEDYAFMLFLSLFTQHVPELLDVLLIASLGIRIRISLAEISWMGNYLYIANIFTNSAKANLKWMTNVTLLIYSIYPIYVYLLIIPTKLSLFPSILRLKNAG